MRLELHILQNFAPSNLNRDDAGNPKDAEFGGYRRARISSQCIKRAIRQHFKDQELIPKDNLGTRTNQLLAKAAELLQKDDREQPRIEQAIVTALAAGKIAMKEEGGKSDQTQYLMFLGENEIRKFVELVDKHFDVLAPKVEISESIDGSAKKKKSSRQLKAAAKESAPEEVQKSFPSILDGGKASDLALFGRMLADLPSKNVYAACQVAHAISTNVIHKMEMDYFTAVDDLKLIALKMGQEEDAGAGMIESTSFNSACFYRYANLDLGQLTKNLQNDGELTKKTVEAFIKASIHAVPSGKQNSFAAHNPPSFVLAVVRDGSPVSLANAFVKPITPDHKGDLVSNSITAIDKYYGQLTKMYGDGGTKSAAVCVLEDVKLKSLDTYAKDSVQAVIDTVVLAAFPSQGA